MRVLRSIAATLLLLAFSGGVVPAFFERGSSASCCARSGGCCCAPRGKGGLRCTMRSACADDASEIQVPTVGARAVLPSKVVSPFVPGQAFVLVFLGPRPLPVAAAPPDPPPRLEA